MRIGEGEGAAVPAAERLSAMIDQCLPAPGALRDDFILWVELWLRAARRPELRETSARLYGRMHEWFREVLEELDGRRPGRGSPTASSRSATATASGCCAPTRRCRGSAPGARSGPRSSPSCG